MDVPTLVWDPKGSITYQRQTFSNVSSCPYLSHWTGKRWETEQELIRLIERFDEYKEEFQPRRWVCLYMTDKVSTEQLLSHVGGYLKVKKAGQNKKI